MILRRRCSVITLILSLFILVLTVNVYFVYVIFEDKYISPSLSVETHVPSSVKIPEVTKLKQNSLKNTHEAPVKSNQKTVKQRKYYKVSGSGQNIATINAAVKIQKAVSELSAVYKNFTTKHKSILDKIISNLEATTQISTNLWAVAEKWVIGTEIVPEVAPQLGSVLNTLCSSKIIAADNSKRGTQLKLALTLDGGQQALFKPQWYSRDEVIDGAVYAGRDRHNAEVAAFHLSLLLNLRRVPLTVGRKIDLRREIIPVASKSLLDTFYQEGNNTCFYGVCMYCEPQSPVCANKDVMEGALIMWLPAKFKFERHASPWQRSYKTDLLARWEVEENFCDKVKSLKQFSSDSSHRLLDLVDAAIFDFLLDNGDRHHYEIPTGLSQASVFLFDNGKSFGNPHRDHIDILSPLYQCCIIRNSTWNRLKLFTGGALSSSLEQLLKFSHISPVLTNAHLTTLDRRLLSVFGAVNICFKEKGISNVLH